MSLWFLLALLPIIAWTVLLLFRHQFWHAQPRLGQDARTLDHWPDVLAIIPARDEADVIETALRSLLEQDYPGRLEIIVVDDQSSDGTGDIVQNVMTAQTGTRKATYLLADERPEGWSGKLWAISTGIEQARAKRGGAPLLLLTDADIAHHPDNLSALTKKMVNENCDFVSIMVRLRSQSVWERLLIPPFVFFFQMLYPFKAVNEPSHSLAAAAGGCILLRRDALEAAGGLAAMKGALIDDVTLGRLIKNRPGGERRIWLGHAGETVSLRAYQDLAPIWSMVARTADTQLGHALSNLVVTVIGMLLLYLLPPLLLLGWPVHQSPMLALLGLVAWLLMSTALLPTLRLYRQSILWAPTLPLAAALYTLMTIDSARLHRQGKGGFWKGRTLSDECG